MYQHEGWRGWEGQCLVERHRQLEGPRQEGASSGPPKRSPVGFQNQHALQAATARGQKIECGSSPVDGGCAREETAPSRRHHAHRHDADASTEEQRAGSRWYWLCRKYVAHGVVHAPRRSSAPRQRRACLQMESRPQTRSRGAQQTHVLRNPPPPTRQWSEPDPFRTAPCTEGLEAPLQLQQLLQKAPQS